MSTLSDEQKLAAADRFAAASRGDDADALRSLFAPDATTWHNFDERDVDTEQSLRSNAWLQRAVPDLTWQDLAVHPTPSGFVSQSILTGTAPGGPLRLHSCLVVTLNDAGLITRIEEYLDSAQTAVLRS